MNMIDNNNFNLLFLQVRDLESKNFKTKKYSDAEMVQLIIRIIEKFVKEEDRNEIFAAENGEFYEV